MQFVKSIDEFKLSNYVVNQLNNVIPDGDIVMIDDVTIGINEALKRVYNCFSRIKTKYYRDNNTCLFNHLNSDHYCVFLYYLSNTVYKHYANEKLATKLFLLNKFLHGIDMFYSIELPDVFMVVHPLGTVLGRAKYDDYFVVYQNCTVGSSKENIYPTLGKGLIMYSKSSIIGNSRLGNNVIISAGSSLINTDVSSNNLIFGTSPNITLKSTDHDILNSIFEINQG